MYALVAVTCGVHLDRFSEFASPVLASNSSSKVQTHGVPSGFTGFSPPHDGPLDVGVDGVDVGVVVGVVVGVGVGVGVGVVLPVEPVEAVEACVPQRWNSHIQNPQLLVVVPVVAALAAAVPLIAGRATPLSDTNTKAPATKHRRRF